MYAGPHADLQVNGDILLRLDGILHTLHSSFSQVGSVGIIANFVFPHISSFHS